MNYIYDILLNFKPELWEFYEWNTKDNITHIRRIPIIRINNDTIRDLINYEVVVGNKWLERIQNKTEVFSEQQNKIIEYACIMVNDLMAIGCLFNKNGKLIGRSSMLIDEEEEAIELGERIETTIIEYKQLEPIMHKHFKTLQEIEKEKYIQSELSNVKDFEKLSYLYYECFNEKPNNEKQIISRFKQELQDHWEEISNKIYNFLKVTSINK